MGFKRIVFVADYFVEHHLGGSEKSLEAILQAAPPGYKIERVLTDNFFPGDFRPKKDFIVLGNFIRLTKETIEEITERFSYAVIESDFKYCKYRLPEMHSAGNALCSCEVDPEYAFMRNIYYNSKLNFFKSKRHYDKHIAALPRLKENRNIILSVTYTPEDLAFLLNLRYSRERFKKFWPWDKPVYAIYDSKNWIKAREVAVEFCKEHKLKYRLLNFEDDREFQIALSKCHGLVFLPKGTESASRITLEAKIMDMELIVNENASIAGDPFFKLPIQDIIEFLKNRPNVFWHELERVL